jgi:hypothetical protein
VFKVLMMPLAAGGAIALGFVVYASVRRWVGAPTLESDVLRRLGARSPEQERDPVGPPDSRPSVPAHPVRVTTEAEAAAVIGAEWPLPPAPDALTTDQPAADADVDAWLTDAEFPDEETAPTQPGMRFERDALDPAPESVPASGGTSNGR